MSNPTDHKAREEDETGYDSVGDVRTGRPPLANQAERVRHNAEVEANKPFPEEEANDTTMGDDSLINESEKATSHEDVEEIDMENPDDGPVP